MHRRKFLLGTIGASVPLAGCSDSEKSGRTYRLRMADRAGGDGEVLDFDVTGIAPGQQRILDAAVEDGSYVEENVTWGTMPGRESISMEFRSVLQLIARHVGRDPAIVEPADFETPSRYARDPFRSVVEVE